jgi:hypothetical protein
MTSHIRLPEDGSSRFLRNFGKYIPVYTTLHFRSPEDGSNRFLRNVCKYIPVYTTLHSEALKMEAIVSSEMLEICTSIHDITSQKP